MDSGKLRPAGRVLLKRRDPARRVTVAFGARSSIAEKIQILHLMEALGINSLDLGLPGAGPRALADCEALAREIVRHENEDSRQLRRPHS
jgi:isopropylmalate/homocitrate/citramalate synthase